MFEVEEHSSSSDNTTSSTRLQYQSGISDTSNNAISWGTDAILAHLSCQGLLGFFSLFYLSHGNRRKVTLQEQEFLQQKGKKQTIKFTKKFRLKGNKPL